MDDILTDSALKEVYHLKAFLHKEFTIKDLGSLHYFLGLEVHYLPNGIVLSQRKFTQELLEDTGFLLAKQTVTSLNPNMKLHDPTSPFLENPSHY